MKIVENEPKAAAKQLEKRRPATNKWNGHLWLLYKAELHMNNVHYNKRRKVEEAKWSIFCKRLVGPLVVFFSCSVSRIIWGQTTYISGSATYIFTKTQESEDLKKLEVSRKLLVERLRPTTKYLGPNHQHFWNNYQHCFT